MHGDPAPAGERLEPCVTRSRSEVEQRRVAQRPRIAVAEDDTEMRELIAFEMRALGYDVTELRDGSQMLDYVVALTAGTIRVMPAVIVSDVRMPGMSGLQVLSTMRSAGLLIPVILMTGLRDPDIHARAEALGVALVLQKPFPTERLRAVVMGFVEGLGSMN